MDGRQVRTWAWVGLAAQVLLIISWIVAGFWQGPRYSVLDHSLSDMVAVTAPAGLFLAVVWMLCGLGTILFVWLSVWPSLREAGTRAAVGCVLLGLSIYGLGDLLAPFKRVACRIADEGCNPGDQIASPGGRLDLIVSIAGILLFISAVFVLAAAMARTHDWNDLARPARWAGITFIVLLVATVPAGGIFGLINRLLAITGAAAIAGLAWRIARSAPKTAKATHSESQLL